MSNVESLLDLADLAISRCEGVTQNAVRDELAQIVRGARRRYGFVGEILVVAFAGGTGSGKSSLINALVGATVAPVGVLRPTTGAALAVIPKNSTVNLDRVLADLDVTEQIQSSTLELSVLIDLPDFDSVVEGHRRIVEDILPRVDAVVWVFDPEKYADALIHTSFLEKLAAYENQFLFAFNQSDRLADSGPLVVADLVRLLKEDGFMQPEVVRTVARGSEIDVSQLALALAQRLDTKRTVISKLVTDLRMAANRGWEESRRAVSGAEKDQGSADRSALASATFVLLGVESIRVLASLFEE